MAKGFIRGSNPQSREVAMKDTFEQYNDALKTLASLNSYSSKDTVKQVIVMRNDLNMQKGKLIAQGAHSSIMWMAKRLVYQCGTGLELHNIALTEEEKIWMNEGFTKICLKVYSDEELLDIKEKANVLGLNVEMITDAGKTEFDGVPTRTCLAIGPHYSSKIDKVTGHLKLL